MSINYTILGILKAKPMSGYDIKKEIQASSYLPWSGNNNQIYKALTQMSGEGLLVGETLHRENGPTKKIYRITEKGIQELSKWIDETKAEIPDIKNPFLIQLYVASMAEPDRIADLLVQYREQLEEQLLIQNELIRRNKAEKKYDQKALPGIDMIYDNVIDFYRTQLEWADTALYKLKKE